MQYFLFGLVAFVLVLMALHGFTRANTAAMARNIRIAGGLLAFAGALVLLIRGLAGYAMPLAMLGSWLLWGKGGVSWPTGRSQPAPGQSSKVATDHLEMELDHDTGAMRGRVLKGVFAGRDIESMAPAELALLWRDCQFADPQSAQLIEAYLDRVHASWREDMARAEAEHGAGGIMTAEEAYEILGLKPGASEDAIRKAHRELMLKMHPDRGGSTYLAAKINEAKEILIGKG